MLGMSKALALMSRFGGISPSSNHVDKYFAITSVLLIIVFPLRRIILHVTSGSTEGSFTSTVRLLMGIATVVLIMRNWIEPKIYMNIMKDLESTGINLQCTSGKRIVRITCIIIVALTLVQAVIYYQISFYLAIYMVLAIILNNGPSLQHMVMVERIQNRFSALNDRVIGIGTDTSIASTELDSIFQQHSSLQALVVNVDLHFCFFNLFSYLSKFGFCVSEMYGYLVSIENDDRQVDFTVLLSFLKQAVFCICQALVCHDCSKEANRTVLLAHRVLQPDSPLDLWKKVGLFSALAVDNKVHFTVGGIFTLDRALITQIALTALSYLIIAVQLREINLF